MRASTSTAMGPSGIIRKLPAAETDYYFYLPMIYPYLVKPQADTFVVQFGGGLSTAVALTKSKRVTVAESNPAVLDAFLHDNGLRRFTGDILHDPRVKVVGYEGRLYLAHTRERYDVIDLSLADSTGLSNPGGFAIVEKFAYTREAMQTYMRALKPGGVLAVTLWNKEEPPKSVLKLYATMVGAARANGDSDVAREFFAASCYLSTTTVLYKKGGFSDAEIALLRKHTKAMSFDAIYYPGFVYDETQTAKVLAGFRNQIFFDASKPPGDDLVAPEAGAAAPDTGPPETDLGRPRHHHGAASMAFAHCRKFRRHRETICLRRPPAHQRPALFRRLYQAARLAAHSRPARTRAG